MSVTPQDTSTPTTALADSSVAASPVQEKPSTFRFLDEEEEEISGTTSSDTITINSQSLEGPGIFKGHLLQVRQSKAQPIVPNMGDWFTISLLILLSLFTWFRFFYYRIFRQLFSAFFNTTTTNQIVRDESVLLQRASLVLSIISYLLMGLFVYQLSVIFNWDTGILDGGLLRFVMFSVAIAAAYSIKMIFLRFLSVIFDQERSVAIYIFNVFLMVMMIGLLLLPVNILLAYSPGIIREIVVVISIAVIGLLFLYRIVRAVLIWTGIPGFSLFYLFLYLCAFEIAPLLIIWKAATL
ncbi:MAG: DUF4271 domain-containing protein [Bacteroidetes bacterium]|nr:DUF4271 domain-containing protein [Bacteroidota bacterium]MBK9317547.1 DUF4271 domain-containing protein [Bacteroidota bacterium]